MSIRANPFKAVPLLLRRLAAREKNADLNYLKSVLTNIKDLFSIVKKNEEELLDTLTLVDVYLRNNIRKLMDEEEDICDRINISTQKLLPAAATQSKIEVADSSDKIVLEEEPKRNENMHGAPFLGQLEDIERFKVNFDWDDPDTQPCLYSLLLHFPKNVVIKKMHIFYWWKSIHWDFKTNFRDIDMLSDFLECKLIVPHGKCPIVNKFIINRIHDKLVTPFLQDKGLYCEKYSQMIASYHHNEPQSSHHNEPQSSHQNQLQSSHQNEPQSSHQNAPKRDCLVLDHQKVKLSDEFGFKSNHWRAIFNISSNYLKFGPQWMAKKDKLEVLHLGRWQDSASHHIEVESEEFLKELRDQKNLKYLSLRGISRIFELPPSIFKLENLEILDLKACHNLETLPNDISSLRKLKHLDVSQCYLLERMPMGIEKLTELRVLKGFVIGSSRKTPCRISDLENLKYLERLSIHIGSEAVIQKDEFESLGSFSTLTHLKISWGVSDKRYSYIQINFPQSLEKLHLEGFRGEEIPNWLALELWRLKVLYITGGKLKSFLPRALGWYNTEIVCLKYLKHLKIDLKDLQKLFPKLRYVEIKQIQDLAHIEWSRK